MKLYLFQCGTIKTWKHLLVSCPDKGQRIEVPVPFFVITHPQGNVLFDTGQPLSETKACVGGDSDYVSCMKDCDHVSRQLGQVGLRTSDISYIVLSHLHSDHAGGLEAFSVCKCFVREDEIKHGSNKSILEKYNLDWLILNGTEEKCHDIFGDGKVKILSTPGHSPGHQSLLLELDKTGPVLLASDSIYLAEIMDKNILPGVYHNLKDTEDTIKMIMDMRKSGVKIITGHDPAEWAMLRLAPEYYE